MLYSATEREIPSRICSASPAHLFYVRRRARGQARNQKPASGDSPQGSAGALIRGLRRVGGFMVCVGRRILGYEVGIDTVGMLRQAQP
jgi:hypothetical protein